MNNAATPQGRVRSFSLFLRTQQRWTALRNQVAVGFKPRISEIVGARTCILVRAQYRLQRGKGESVLWRQEKWKQALYFTLKCSHSLGSYSLILYKQIIPTSPTALAVDSRFGSYDSYEGSGLSITLVVLLCKLVLNSIHCVS